MTEVLVGRCFVRRGGSHPTVLAHGFVLLQTNVMNDNKNLHSIDANAIPWEERFNEHVGASIFRKELFSDPDTGMLVRLVRYPAGVFNPRHTHPCGHGMYVLEGTLVTHQGTFGPGSFVWFPEGQIMEHGASADGDVTVVFITNKPFRIDYLVDGT